MLNLVKDIAFQQPPVLGNDRRAAGALEYALLVAFIALAVVGGATTFGNDLQAWFTGLGATAAAWTN